MGCSGLRCRYSRKCAYIRTVLKRAKFGQLGQKEVRTLHAFSLSIVYAAVFTIATRNWLLNSQRMAILLRKVVEMIEFDLAFYKVLVALPPSLMFQVLYEKPVPKFKFFHKWLEGKRVLNEPEGVSGSDPGKADKEEVPFQVVPTTASTTSIPKGIKQRTIAKLRAFIEFNQRHCDRLRADTKIVIK
ncbi:hypothetical protein GOBAR_AA23313 [Gossypium barbadense]|uniref:Uncharacterized protein n=1 Tax=Gossypium barbadense TaxID=3634 RepID=A0A2P5X1Z4_GOSBA|nr:hypothetical protein GOBAR_AA23313 [Gossypium barbadense]